ncbi:Hypothetical predicted protein [Prunus dulcis]|uniref:Uncharacterized protein n=1 Tax=Prunus dulcis TaxID=3755 RepID=A0A5E4GCH8_PRUDU|nr:hypothetical protein L3X38_005676 [Prunus dulcis]VVA34193.1 Hypothetical predicted protein [Prunus dulcis]VVA37406.1 Hypothetical predicted protein [Prunus dulcis]
MNKVEINGCKIVEKIAEECAVSACSLGRSRTDSVIFGNSAARLKKKKDNEEEQKHQGEEKKKASTKSHKNVEVEHEALVTITDLTSQLVVGPTNGIWVIQLYEDLFDARLIRYNEFEPQCSFVYVEVEVGSNKFVITNKDYQ